MIKKISLIIFSCLLLMHSSAQVGMIFFKKANKEYSQFKFAFAIPLYQKHLKYFPTDKKAMIQLATCFEKTNQYDSAIRYFEKAILNGAKIGNQLAELYAAVGAYQNATKKYEEIKTDNETLLTNARLYGFMHLSSFFIDSLDYKIKHLAFNSIYNDFAPVPYKNGIVFASNRIDKTKKYKKISGLSGWDGAKYAQLYFANEQDSVSSLFSPIFKNKLNVGTISFTQDYKQAYFTKNANKRGKRGVHQLEIWSIKWKNGNWEKPKKLFFNNPSFSYFHPAVTPDGNRLYFVSDDTTGFGGTDIYYVDKNEDGSWKSTQNAGQIVNTSANELFLSFYDGTLFFSSNGHAGLGGLDIFRIASNDRAELEIRNMGYPINSSKDDLAFSLMKNKGYFSSNRTGNDEVYAFDYNKKLVELTGQIEKDTLIKTRSIVYLTQLEQNGAVKVLDSSLLDDYGNYTFKVRPNRAYQIIVKNEAGFNQQIDVTSNDYQSKDKLTFSKLISPIRLQIPESILIAKKKLEDSIKMIDASIMTRKFKRAIDSLATMSNDYTVLHHPFDQVFVVKDDLNNYYKLIERVKSMKGKKIVIVSATDCVGDEAYNNDLSNRRANRIYKTLSKLGDHLVEIKYVGESELIQPCDETTQQLNRYSYVFIINK